MKKIRNVIVKFLMLFAIIVTQALPTSLVLAIGNDVQNSPEISIVSNRVVYSDNEEILVNDQNVYNLDFSSKVDKKVKIEVEMNFDNMKDKKYYVVERLNNIIYDIDDTGYSILDSDMHTYTGLIDFSDLVSGSFNYSITIYDEEGNIINISELLFAHVSDVPFVIDESLDVSTMGAIDLINYQAVNADNLGLSNNKIDLINEQIRKYEKSIYFDSRLNSTILSLLGNEQEEIDPEFNTYDLVNGKEISLLTGLYGKFDFANSEDKRVRRSYIEGYINSKYNDENVSIRLLNGQNIIESESDPYLKTGMQLEVVFYGIKNIYNIVVAGNIISEEAIISDNDLDKLLGLRIGDNDLSDLELVTYRAGDINNDGILNVLDASNMVNILGNNLLWEDVANSNDTIDSEIKFKVSVDSKIIRVGDTFKVYLELKNFKDNDISALEGIINYDSDYVKLTGIKNMTNWYTDINFNNGKFITVSKNGIDTDTTLLEFSFLALKVGNSNISIDDTLMAFNGKKVISSNSLLNTVDVSINRNLSGNNNIKELTFDVGKLKDPFDARVLEHTLYVDCNVKSVTLSGLLEDNTAKTDGFKSYDLIGNKTVIGISVKAENGSVKTYVINVIKVDNRSNNNFLSSLSIDGYELNFSRDVLTYELSVNSDIDSLKIVAMAEDNAAVVNISGNTNLVEGKNTIVVKVKAENGSIREYKINVTKAAKVVNEEESNDVENNSKLLLIILIVATLGALIYLIFRDDDKDDSLPKFNLKDKPEDDKAPEVIMRTYKSNGYSKSSGDKKAKAVSKVQNKSTVSKKTVSVKTETIKADNKKIDNKKTSRK